MEKLNKAFLAIFLICGILVIGCGLIYAAVPHLINYQGRLTDASGVPLTGTHDLTFRIYDAEAAGNLLWQETHSGALIQKGVFSILLGSVTNLDLPFDKAYFLEIKVGSEIMSPRQRLSSAGYALRAEKAEDANSVANVGVSTAPAPNKLLPLDNNAKLPVTALKVYDSGWFAVSASTLYTKTHGLGTTKVLTSIYFSPNPNGSGVCAMPKTAYAYEPYHHDNTMCVTALSTTEISVRNYEYAIYSGADSSGNPVSYTSGYIRIIMLALE